MSKELSNVTKDDPIVNLGQSLAEGTFEFKKARYLVELTGQSAAGLDEFVKALEIMEPSTLFYHVYHPLLDAHLVPYEFPNDFSFWFSDAIQDKDLAEQVANIDLPKQGGLEELRQILLAKTRKALAGGSSSRVHKGNEFHFVKCKFVVYPSGYTARNIDELADGISTASELSVFYHMVTSRLLGKTKHDDFSAWILANSEHKGLVERLGRVDPSTHVSVRALKHDVVDVVQRYLRENRTSGKRQN